MVLRYPAKEIMMFLASNGACGHVWSDAWLLHGMDGCTVDFLSKASAGVPEGLVPPMDQLNPMLKQHMR